MKPANYKLRILITGACGVTSRSVVRSLQISSIFKDKCEFIGTDVCCNLYGVFEGLYQKVYHVPGYNEKEYRNIMESILSENNIDVAIIIPEPEVLYWSENPFNVKFMQIPPQFAKIAISKRRLYEVLQGTDLVPDFQIIDKKKVLTNKSKIHLSYPFWVRDYSEGTTSGKGSFAPSDYEELKAWLSLNPEIDNFMFSAYLPGRNLACFLLYNKGVLLKYGVAQRIDYLMGKVSMSGITGNTCKGKLLNDPDIFETAQKAVEIIFEQTGETKHGLIVVDLKEDQNRKVLVTEINIRHVAFTSSFADAGFNFSEYQLLCILNREKELLSEKEKIYPEDNLILRDVDGLPIYIEQFEELKVGDYYIQNA